MAGGGLPGLDAVEKRSFCGRMKKPARRSMYFFQALADLVSADANVLKKTPNLWRYRTHDRQRLIGLTHGYENSCMKNREEEQNNER